VALGIGTVPVISILKELHALKDTRPVHLFLAVNNRDEIPERQTVEKIAAAMDNLTLHTMIFPEEGLKYSEDFFRENLPDHQRYSYYLCSSPGVRAAVLAVLSGLGVKEVSHSL
jgi:predicted ferric reductase